MLSPLPTHATLGNGFGFSTGSIIIWRTDITHLQGPTRRTRYELNALFHEAFPIPLWHTWYSGGPVLEMRKLKHRKANLFVQGYADMKMWNLNCSLGLSDSEHKRQDDLAVFWVSQHVYHSQGSSEDSARESPGLRALLCSMYSINSRLPLHWTGLEETFKVMVSTSAFYWASQIGLREFPGSCSKLQWSWHFGFSSWLQSDVLQHSSRTGHPLAFLVVSG